MKVFLLLHKYPFDLSAYSFWDDCKWCNDDSLKVRDPSFKSYISPGKNFPL
jgi:hypothetical protein